MSFPSSVPYGHQYPNQQASPKREQWAIINNYKALEFQRLKQLEKQADYQKKRQFKHQLDIQLSSKNNTSQFEKQEDKRYYDYITKKTQQQKNQQDKQKIDKIIKRKHIQQQNQYHLEHMRNSRNRDEPSGYDLNIGIKSQEQRRIKENEHKKQMLDTLDKQLRIKQQQKKYQKMHDLEVDGQNLKYQFEQFDRRNNRHKNYGQNPKVYEYYRDLQLQRLNREKQLEHRIVNEAAQKKLQQENYKQYLKESQKKHKTEDMKNTLNQQIQFHQYMDKQKTKFNPEENTYSVIGNIFRDKPSPYDKRAYSEYLKRQAEQQSKIKKKNQYMSEQQYRLNMNQLNRALNGNYAYENYIDRSLGAIGDSKKVNMTQINDTIHDQDTQVVKMKLQNIKGRLHPTRSHNTSGIF